MSLDSPAGLTLTSSLVLAVLGLLVAWLAGTRARALIGVHDDAPWWFSPRGARAQGLALAYLAGLVAVGALAALLVLAALPDARSLAWTASWVSVAVVLAVTVVRMTHVVVDAGTGGRAVWEEPVDADYVRPDEVLDDVDLRVARDAALAGDWRPAAHLLAATADPDSRFDRVATLADAALRRTAWLDAWLREAPEDRDALALRAQAAVVRAWEIRGAEWRPRDVDRFTDALHDAEEFAREAIRTHPDDPSPHVTLLTAARGQEVPRHEFDLRLEALRRVAPHHRQGHEQALQYLAEKWFGSSEEMFAFARETSADAGPGSALNLLVVTAHVEQWMILSTRSPARAARYMESDGTKAEIAAAERRWNDGGPSPVGKAAAHNLLGFAWWLAQEAAAAAPHLEQTRRHLGEFPWALADDAREAHASAQAWVRSRTRTPSPEPAA